MSGELGSRLSARMLSLVPAAALAVLGLVNAWTAGGAGVGIDYFQYWAAGQVIREGLVPNIYSGGAGPRMAEIFRERAAASGQKRYQAAAEFRKDEIQIASTPFLYALVNLSHSGDYETDIRRHRAVLLACSVASILFLCAWCGFTTEGTLLFLAFATWALVPLQNDLLDGNVNGIQLALLTLYLFVHRRASSLWISLAAGAVLGLAVAFKPNLAFIPVALGIYWIVNRRFGHLLARAAGAILGVLIAIGSSSLFFGSPSFWISWARTLRRLEQRFDVGVDLGNFGGARLIWDWSGVNVSPLLFAGLIAVLALSLWMGRRVAEGRWGSDLVDPDERGGCDAEFLMVGVGPIIPILSSGLAWPHYLVLALPLCIYLLRPRDRGGVYPWAVLAALLLIASEPALRALNLGGDYAIAAGMAAGSLLLFVVACLEAWRPEGG